MFKEQDRNALPASLYENVTGSHVDNVAGAFCEGKSLNLSRLLSDGKLNPEGRDYAERVFTKLVVEENRGKSREEMLSALREAYKLDVGGGEEKKAFRHLISSVRARIVLTDEGKENFKDLRASRERTRKRALRTVQALVVLAGSIGLDNVLGWLGLSTPEVKAAEPLAAKDGQEVREDRITAVATNLEHLRESAEGRDQIVGEETLLIGNYEQTAEQAELTVESIYLTERTRVDFTLLEGSDWSERFLRDAHTALMLFQPFYRYLPANIDIDQVDVVPMGMPYFGQTQNFVPAADGTPYFIREEGVFNPQVYIGRIYSEFYASHFREAFAESDFENGIGVADFSHELGHAAMFIDVDGVVVENPLYAHFREFFYNASPVQESAPTPYSANGFLPDEDFADSIALYLNASAIFREARPYRWAYFEWIARGNSPESFSLSVAAELLAPVDNMVVGN